MRYTISYDLKAPGKDYQTLWNALAAIGAKRVLESEWVANRTGTDTVKLRDHFRQFMDSNDRILVTELDGPGWAGFNLMTDLNAI